MRLRTISLVAALAVTTPAWAQVPVSADDLNRQELSRLAGIAPAAAATAPPIGYTIASPTIAAPQALVPPLSYAGQSPLAERYPFSWLNRYYGYQPLATYEYIDSGPEAHYAPVPVLADWY
ncbi:MAG TPA: hypothetical protein VET89_14565 [Stellaceae bacterium]|nr:hypothetical protein [Stellaceae bacterium]